MAVTVRCERCGSTYETEAPPAAIREVNRCSECGGGPLVIEDEEARAADSSSQQGPSVA